MTREQIASGVIETYPRKDPTPPRVPGVCCARACRILARARDRVRAPFAGGDRVRAEDLHAIRGFVGRVRGGRACARLTRESAFWQRARDLRTRFSRVHEIGVQFASADRFALRARALARLWRAACV